MVGKRGKIAIPLVLNMYELFPFWYTFFKVIFIIIVQNENFSLNRNNVVLYERLLIHILRIIF